MPMIAWYFICASAAYAGSDIISWGYVTAIVGGSMLCAASASGIATMGVAHLLWRRNEVPALRRQLVALVTERAGQRATWLCADEAVRFRAITLGRGPLRRCMLMRTNLAQDDAVLDAGPGTVADVTGDVFRVAVAEPGFQQLSLRERLLVGAGGTTVSDPAGSTYAEAEAGPGTGLRWFLPGILQDRDGGRARAASLRDVLRQFEAAQPIDLD